MTAAEARELESYKTLYNANKISYLLRENVELQEPNENRLLRYDGNTHEVDRLKSIVKGADRSTIEVIEDRRKRIMLELK
jgi:hypothetical protein